MNVVSLSQKSDQESLQKEIKKSTFELEISNDFPEIKDTKVTDNKF